MLRFLRAITTRQLVMASTITIAAATYADAPITSVDSFTSTTSVNTETLEHDNGCSGVLGCLLNQDQYLIRLSGMLNRDKTIPSHCLLVQYGADEWAFFVAAHDSTGTPLTVSVVENRLGRPYTLGGVTETVCVQLSKPYLQGLRGNPLILRLEGKRKSMVLNVPSTLIADYLAAVSDWTDTATTSSTVRRISLGVQYAVIDRAALTPLQINADFGQMVLTVAPGSLAERSGLRAGDVILAIDEAAVGNAQNLADVAQAWTRTKPGKLAISRNRQVMEIIIRPDFP